MDQSMTPGDLRRQNRSRVLGRIVRGGASTRLALAAELGLSAATISNVVRDLRAEGLVADDSSLPSRGGRPSLQIAVRRTGAYFLGADVGESVVAMDLYDLALEPVDRVRVVLPTRSARPAEIRRALDEALSALRARCADVWPRVVGLGLGLPGIVDTSPSGERVLYAQNIGWEPMPVGDLLAVPGLTVLAANGAKANALAELWRGSADPHGTTVVALLGRGLGAGLVSRGRIVQGYTSSVGEWGHTKVMTVGAARCGCGGVGCLESLIGGDAIVDRYLAAGGRRASTPEETLDDLIADADLGRPDAARVLDETVEVLGLGLANLVNLLNPARIVVGGWSGRRLMAAHGEQVISALRRSALRHPAERVEVVASRLGPDAVALGACSLVVDSFVNDGVDRP